MIVALRFHGTGLPAVALLPGKRVFTIGSGTADVVVPRIVASEVADVHAIVERTADGLRLTESGGNGIYRNAWTPAVTELLLHAGQVGWVGSVAVQALDDRLVTLRPRVAWNLGLDAHAAVDDALAVIATRAPLLLLGPRGTEGERLARAIHEATDGARAFVETDRPIPHLEDATLYVDLDGLTRLPASRAAELLRPWRDLRVIFNATSERHASGLLDSHLASIHTLTLPPLATRRAEVPRLLGALWHQLGSGCDPATDLSPAALLSLTAHDWPGNLASLRDNARRILAYHHAGGLRPAARTLGIKHQTLAGHFNRIGFPMLDEIQREERLDRKHRAPRADRKPPRLTANPRSLRCLRAKPLASVPEVRRGRGVLARHPRRPGGRSAVLRLRPHQGRREHRPVRQLDPRQGARAPPGHRGVRLGPVRVRSSSRDCARACGTAPTPKTGTRSTSRPWRSPPASTPTRMATRSARREVAASSGAPSAATTAPASSPAATGCPCRRTRAASPWRSTRTGGWSGRGGTAHVSDCGCAICASDQLERVCRRGASTPADQLPLFSLANDAEASIIHRRMRDLAPGREYGVCVAFGDTVQGLYRDGGFIGPMK